MLRIIVIVLAVVGALFVASIAAMALMHFGMFAGMRWVAADGPTPTTHRPGYGATGAKC